MNKTALKSFATNARKELMKKVEAKALQIGITEDRIRKVQFESSDAIYIGGKQLSATEKNQRDKLIQRINEIGFSRVIEEVAYTWFNRFTALRFMEVNNYLPTQIRVLSSSNAESTEPDIVNKALSVDLEIDKELVYELKLNNKTEELFKYVVIKQCNSLNKFLPFMFETIDDYKEILFPEGLLARESFLREMTDLTNIPESDWEQVEIIGWLYQFYIAEEKDRVFKEKKKYKAEEIPYATQLFTPDWIVRYMVQNSLGQYWLDSHPEDKVLREKWEYYMANPSPESDFAEKLAPYINKELRVEDIKCFDPAMGSGHILVYMFDVLYEIYNKCGYMEREIPRLIIENNLFGLDIDDRANQLASFSVVMKALEYNRRFLRSIEREGLTLNLAAIQESNVLTDEDIAYFVGENCGEEFDNTKAFVKQFQDAKTIGSLIKVTLHDTTMLLERLETIKATPVADLFEIEKRERVLSLLPKLINQTQIMGQSYDVLVTNPPYMGSGSMNKELSDFLKKNYPDSKGDLFASFMELDHYIKKNGFYASINQHSWMFLSSFEKLREKIIRNKWIENMLHLGPRAFEEIGGEVVQSTVFVLRNATVPDVKGVYVRLIDERTAKEKKARALESIQNPTVSYRYLFDQGNFSKIPGSPVAYWTSESFQHIFVENPTIGEISSPRQGMATADNDRFVRLWFEVEYSKFALPKDELPENFAYRKKWFAYNNGGKFRRWYGNNEDVVNWENNGQDIKGYDKAVVRNPNYYFIRGLTWSAISSNKLSLRAFTNGTIFSNAGFCIFVDDIKTEHFIHAFMNSKLSIQFLQVLSPTLNYNVGDIAKLPLIIDPKVMNEVSGLVQENVKISKEDWDSFETSWDFIRHPLLRYHEESSTLKEAYMKWSSWNENQRHIIKRNDEELNRIFIDLYSMDDVTPGIEETDITIRIHDCEKDIKSLISYAIGCFFGRYSLDEDGLVYAGGKFEPAKYQKFISDEDNIIPVVSNGYFEDDIFTKFSEFLKVTFGEEKLIENLEFVAETLGLKEGVETAKETIRRYLLNDFFKDHLQAYKRKPIYWLFTSGKQKAFNCLIYMHRYDKSTLSRIRIDYLHELQIRLDTEKKSFLDVIEGDGTAKEISNAKKELRTLDLKIEELRAYDEQLHHMADMQIEIDLDDGVAVNYAKFGSLLATIK